MNNSNLTLGDRNNSSINLQQTTLPSSETVDIASELEALKALLTELRSPDQRKIENAIADAQDELTKPQPNKDEVGQALDRALTYAQKTGNFAESIEKLRLHVEKSAAWLGENWYKLLTLVSLTL
ncbi:MAG: hypothetical protein SFY66_21250 [Oculatellaceae cyanobacterium bins.114]|nr:hypothetical protein [Oculatellaceae cyanobacterium bins.114]